jgi:hypothetical protein
MNQTKRLNEKIISLVTCLDDGGRVVVPPVSRSPDSPSISCEARRESDSAGALPAG